MELQLVRYSEEYKEGWDRFLKHTVNGTFLHSRKFFQHNEVNATDDHSLMFYKKNQLVALFPAIAYEKEGEMILHSHLRSTYGGVLYKTCLAVADLESAIILLTEYARKNQFSRVVIRPTFTIYHCSLAAEFDYLLWKNRFEIASRELELAIDLSLDLEENLDDSTRRSVRKAAKSGVVVEETENYASYWDVLERNLHSRYGKKPVHSLDQINLLRNLVGKENIRLFCAMVSGKIVGGILTFAANDRVLHAQYIASDLEFQDYRPLNAVIYFISVKAKEEKFKYFNLGMVSEPGGRDFNYGLSRFKEGFGARGVLRETMQLSL
jgi:hypothetical protein